MSLVKKNQPLATANTPNTDGLYQHHIILSDLKETDIDLMLDELKHLGEVSQVEKQHHGLETVLKPQQLKKIYQCGIMFCD